MRLGDCGTTAAASEEAPKEGWAAALGDGRRLRGGGGRSQADTAVPAKEDVGTTSWSASERGTNRPGDHSAREQELDLLGPRQAKAAGEAEAHPGSSNVGTVGDARAHPGLRGRAPSQRPLPRVRGTEVWAVCRYRASSGKDSNGKDAGQVCLEPGDKLTLTHPLHDGLYRGRHWGTQKEIWFPEYVVSQRPVAAHEAIETQGLQQLPPAPAPPGESPQSSATFVVVDPAPEAAAPAPTTAWRRYVAPDTGRFWFHNERTEECFFADAASPTWTRFRDEGGRVWWWNDSTEDWFYEDDC